MESIIETLKKNSYKYTNEKYNKLKDTFIEMSCHKSEFDIEKLTIRKQGNFIAHNYHFLIRQYSLALGEMRRLNLDREEKMRELSELKNLQEKKIEKLGKKYVDIEIRRIEIRVDQLEMDIATKAYSCDHFEKCRLKLIQMNNGKEPTNEDWQREEPDYIKWFLERELYYDVIGRQTGIRTGVLNNIDMLEESPVINEDFVRQVSKRGDIKVLEDELEKQKKIQNRYNGNGNKELEHDNRQ